MWASVPQSLPKLRAFTCSNAMAYSPSKWRRLQLWRGCLRSAGGARGRGDYVRRDGRIKRQEGAQRTDTRAHL